MSPLERIVGWVGLWRNHRANRRLSKAIQLADAWQLQSKRLLSKLDSASIKLEELLTEVKDLDYDLNAQAERVKGLVEDSGKLISQQSVALESLRSENTILGSEVELLTTANRRALERYKTEMSIEAMRQIATTREEK